MNTIIPLNCFLREDFLNNDITLKDNQGSDDIKICIKLLFYIIEKNVF